MFTGFSIFLWGFTVLVGGVGAQQQDPTTMNGGSVLAMAGDGCVALAMDKRFGSGPQMVNIGPRHVLTPHPNLIVAFTGLEGDVQSLSQELSVQVKAKLGRALGFMGNRRQRHANISPSAMATLTSHVLYSRKQSPYYVEPIVVGLEPYKIQNGQNDQTDRMGETNQDASSMPEGTVMNIGYRPFLCGHDLLGAQSRSHAFVCAGAASKSLYGTAEALWKPDLSSQELVQACGKAFLSALERDCLSGYGATVYIITKDGVVEYDLACRND